MLRAEGGVTMIMRRKRKRKRKRKTKQQKGGTDAMTGSKMKWDQMDSVDDREFR